LSTTNENGILTISKLRSLKLAKCGITNIDPLFEELKKSPNSMGAIDLSDNKITDPHNIVQYVGSPNGSITKVDLSGNPLTAEGLQEIQECKGSVIFNRHAVSVPLLSQPKIQQQATPAQVGGVPPGNVSSQQRQQATQVGGVPSGNVSSQQQQQATQVGGVPSGNASSQQQ
jgi:hypothetical protein